MDRCEHGFVTCYPCKHQAIMPGCYVPGCEDRKTEGEKFCPKHGGTYAAHWSADDQKEDDDDGA